jgi:aminoglycoside phosphotransferase (APT) family kinase protein
MTHDALRRRPPDATLNWVTRSIGDGSRIVSLRRLTHGGWHANHALSVVDRAGEAHRLVLRRWARPEWIVEDPDFTAEREAAALNQLSATPVPAPELVAADPDADICDVPALLITRLPGRPPGIPADMDAFLTGLARALVAIHAAGERLRGRVPGYRTYHDHRAATTPRWSSRPDLWERALELALTEPPLGPRCFIHRDYHPENTLWSRGRLTGVVDWTAASWGPPAVDTAHMRWNLAITYGPDTADEFLRLHRSLASESFPNQTYWDVSTVLDLVCELDPNDWPSFDLARLERYLGGVLERNLAGLGA